MTSRLSEYGMESHSGLGQLNWQERKTLPNEVIRKESQSGSPCSGFDSTDHRIIDCGGFRVCHDC